jgi:hypothetical protein
LRVIYGPDGHSPEGRPQDGERKFSPSGIQKCTAAMWDRAVCVFLDTPLAQSVSVFLKAKSARKDGDVDRHLKDMASH